MIRSGWLEIDRLGGQGAEVAVDLAVDRIKATDHEQQRCRDPQSHSCEWHRLSSYPFSETYCGLWSSVAGRRLVAQAFLPVPAAQPRQEGLCHPTSVATTERKPLYRRAYGAETCQVYRLQRLVFLSAFLEPEIGLKFDLCAHHPSGMPCPTSFRSPEGAG